MLQCFIRGNVENAILVRCVSTRDDETLQEKKHVRARNKMRKVFLKSYGPRHISNSRIKVGIKSSTIAFHDFVSLDLGWP